MMADIRNILIFAVLCTFAGDLSQASIAEERPPHFTPHFPPHFPPHIPISHEEPIIPHDAPSIPHKGPPFPHEAPSIPDRATLIPNAGLPTPYKALLIPHESLSFPNEAPPVLHGAPPYSHEAPPIPQDKPHDHDIPEWIHIDSGVYWTPCDIDAGPRTRCHDCSSRLICTLLGGLVLDCPYKSYCSNGVCSHAPSEECV